MHGTRTKTVRARMMPELKENVENIFESMGLSPSQAIVLFYKQVELHNGLPFTLQAPSPCPPHLDMSKMTKSQFDAELQTAIDSAHSGNVRPFSEFYSSFRKERADEICH